MTWFIYKWIFSRLKMPIYLKVYFEYIFNSYQHLVVYHTHVINLSRFRNERDYTERFNKINHTIIQPQWSHTSLLYRCYNIICVSWFFKVHVRINFVWFVFRKKSVSKFNRKEQFSENSSQILETCVYVKISFFWTFKIASKETWEFRACTVTW